MSEPTFYEQIGGMPVIERIVARFYEGVATDDVLGPMYPAEDLADGSAARRLTLFLAQYWGGPTTYNQERGHPRLRMRHAPFTVNRAAQERWLTHFREGLDEVGARPGARREVLGLRHLRRRVHAELRRLRPVPARLTSHVMPPNRLAASPQSVRMIGENASPRPRVVLSSLSGHRWP